MKILLPIMPMIREDYASRHRHHHNCDLGTGKPAPTYGGMNPGGVPMTAPIRRKFLATGAGTPEKK